MLSKIGNYIKIGFLWLFSLQPFFIAYLYSDIFYHVIRLIGYRRSVINKNLQYSFPDKTKEELREIRLKFYRNFCDSFIETIMIQNMTASEMKKRVVFKNTEYIDKVATEGKDIIAVMGHYCCWEWVPSINLHLKETIACATYRPLKNKEFDKYMLRIRSKWGNLNFTMAKTTRELINLKRQNQRFLIGLIADQSPDRKKIQYWTNFLNQNTAVLLGPEKLAQSFKAPVVFLKMDRISRGKYEVEVVPLVEDPVNTKEHEITEIHVQYLESIIQNKPENWLWSHKRWKYSEERTITNNTSNQDA